MSTAVDEEVETPVAAPGEPVTDEEGEEADADETPPEPEPEPEPAALSEKELEKMFGKLEKEAEQHRKRLDLILGEDALALEPCPLCPQATAGFYFPVELDDEKRAAVLAAIGMGETVDFAEDDEARMCERCHGLGETRTGSLVPAQMTRVCTVCQGNGWTTAVQRNAQASTMAVRAELPASNGAEPVEPQPTFVQPPFDAWQRPLGHEFYGMNPVYMTAEQRGRDVSA